MTARSRLARLLESPAFLTARARAAEIVDDARALRGLLNAVNSKELAVGEWAQEAGDVGFDLACAVLEAHIDEIEEGCPAQRQAMEDARLRLVIAGLTYVAAEDGGDCAEGGVAPGVDSRVDRDLDACEDTTGDVMTHGRVDDLTILGWIRQVVQNDAMAAPVVSVSTGAPNPALVGESPLERASQLPPV